MGKIVIYQDNTRAYMDSTISIHVGNNEIILEIDVTNATTSEIETLKSNPYDQALIENITERVV